MFLFFLTVFPINALHSTDTRRICICVDTSSGLTVEPRRAFVCLFVCVRIRSVGQPHLACAQTSLKQTAVKDSRGFEPRREPRTDMNNAVVDQSFFAPVHTTRTPLSSSRVLLTRFLPPPPPLTRVPTQLCTNGVLSRPQTSRFDQI